MSKGLAAQLEEQGVVPVIRSDTVKDAVATGRAALAAGMSVVELTRSTPGVEAAIEQLVDDGATVGLGTVTDARDIPSAAAAGVSFVVSFANPPGLLEQARALGLEAIPGTLTPSELLAAQEAGASIVKLFPARTLGPSYLRDLRAVMPGLKVMATGGIGLADGSIGDWLAAGALAVGLGSDLGRVATIGVADVAKRAREALAQAEAARR